MSLDDLEALERRLSHQRRNLHDRIDWMRGNRGDEATLVGLLGRERELSDRRRELHRAIDKTRARGTASDGDRID